MNPELIQSYDALTAYIKAAFHQNDSLLNDAKELWAESIQSVRQLENIQSVDQFLKLLIRKGLFGPDRDIGFRMFMKIIQDNDFERMAKEHNNLIKEMRDSHEPRKINVYHGSFLPNGPSMARGPSLPRPSAPDPNVPVTTNRIPGHQRNHIFNILAGGNGISTREFSSFARQLLIFDESEIRDIENDNRSSSQRTMVLMERFELRSNSFRILLRALGPLGIQRRDLVRQLEPFQ